MKSALFSAFRDAAIRVRLTPLPPHACTVFHQQHQPCLPHCAAPALCPAALNLPQWLNLSTARSMLLDKLMGHVAVASLDAEEADKLRRQVMRWPCSFSSLFCL